MAVYARVPYGAAAFKGKSGIGYISYPATPVNARNAMQCGENPRTFCSSAETDKLV